MVINQIQLDRGTSPDPMGWGSWGQPQCLCTSPTDGGGGRVGE